MTIKDAMQSTGIDRLDAEVLLAAHLGKDRVWLISHESDEVQDENNWHHWVERRKKHEPVAYITGTKEFYGHDFIVNKDVLVPRPETEYVVDLALDIFDINETTIRSTGGGIVAAAFIWGSLKGVKTVCDVCTGSGCIAIALKLERPSLDVFGCDISKEALSVANENSLVLEADVDFRHGDLLSPLDDIKEPFLIVSNPPYVPSGHELPTDVYDFEPHIALFSGAQGVYHTQKILDLARNHPYAQGIVLECRQNQLEVLDYKA
ncbi:MAG: peptide chain release factor N(5)-glutamine methyltransferase [Candidatus Peribacteraceae bacterium]|nr:peptide chain release factor N(5)-glutamine methyltransferase [Candidatus Peribacteraceae bacterium]MDP7476853.1 peptide chain release factor N(5)-glutamine methyltransferase [Candidatus Peribacteraceae bacterium]